MAKKRVGILTGGGELYDSFMTLHELGITTNTGVPRRRWRLSHYAAMAGSTASMSLRRGSY